MVPTLQFLRQSSGRLTANQYSDVDVGDGKRSMRCPQEAEPRIWEIYLHLLKAPAHAVTAPLASSTQMFFVCPEPFRHVPGTGQFMLGCPETPLGLLLSI